MDSTGQEELCIPGSPQRAPTLGRPLSHWEACSLGWLGQQTPCFKGFSAPRTGEEEVATPQQNSRSGHNRGDVRKDGSGHFLAAGPAPWPRLASRQQNPLSPERPSSEGRRDTQMPPPSRRGRPGPGLADSPSRLLGRQASAGRGPTGEGTPVPRAPESMAFTCTRWGQ